MTTQINLPFVTATAEGPKHLDLQLTRAKLTELTSALLERTVGPTKQALADAGIDGVRHRPRRARRRHDPHAGGAGEGHRAARQGAAQGRQPGRGRRGRRRDPGRRAQGRGQGRAPARRHPAVARHRDQGRRDDEADRAQHDDPDAQVGDLHDGRGQPAVGRDPRAPGRVGDGRRSTRRSASSSSSASRRRCAGCRRSRCRSTSTRTGSSTSRPRTTAPATSSRSRSRAARACRRTRSRRWSRTPRRTPSEAHKLRELADAKNMAETLAYQTEKSLAEHRDKLDPADAATLEGRVMELKQVLESGDLETIRAKTEALNEAAQPLAQALYADAQAGPAPAGATGNGDGSSGRGRGRRGRRLRGDRRRDGDQGVSDELHTDAIAEPWLDADDAGEADEAAASSAESAAEAEPRPRPPSPPSRPSGTSTSPTLQRLAADFDNYRKRARPRPAGLRGAGRRAARREAAARARRPRARARRRRASRGGEGDRGRRDDALGARRTRSPPRAWRRSRPRGSFDPHVHEALLAQPAEGVEPGSIIQVVQRGYRLGDAVLRPARVIVAE